MTFDAMLISLLAIALVAAAFLWELGADRLLSRAGCFIIRIVTFNCVRIPADRIDNTAEISVGAATLIFFAVALVILKSFFH